MRWPVGGIRTYLLYHYPALAAAGYRFTFVVPDDADSRTFAEEVRAWSDAEVVTVTPTRRRWPVGGTVRALLRSRRFDLVHAHGTSAAAQVALANLGLGIPLVVHLHEVLRPERFAGPAGGLRLWLLGRLLRRASAVVSVSADAQANLLEFLPGLARSRCRLVPILSGVDTERFATRGRHCPGLRERLGIGPEVFLIGFLGRFMEEKGFPSLLRALELLEARGAARPFHVAAVGSSDYRREYRAEAERRGLGGHITFLDFVHDVAPVLWQLDLLVMPSLWEGCGLLAMEAMAAGTPVLGSDCVGLREVLAGTPARTAPAGDAAALCAALADALASRWTEAARAYAPIARERFCAGRAAERLRQVFEDCLAV